MKNKSSTTQVVYHVFQPWWFYGMILGCIVTAPCCLAEWLNHLSRGGLLRWANECLASYWHFLNAIFSLGGWKHGFGSFWNYHPHLATVIFLAIPILGGRAMFFVLKRERLAVSIILLLHAWHYGLSTFIKTPTQWMTLFVVVALAIGLLWSFRLVKFIQNARMWQKGRDCLNNVGDEIQKSFLNYRHRKNENILHKQTF